MKYGFAVWMAGVAGVTSGGPTVPGEAAWVVWEPAEPATHPRTFVLDPSSRWQYDRFFNWCVVPFFGRLLEPDANEDTASYELPD
jgi:hypothetical protein